MNTTREGKTLPKRNNVKVVYRKVQDEQDQTPNGGWGRGRVGSVGEWVKEEKACI